jgi:hypothetical protein
LKIVIAASLWAATATSPLGHAQQPDSEARAVVGFEQAGASAAKAEQHFFFDFFIDRKLKSDWVSLWGNLRIASFPQQIASPVAQFATEFIASVSSLKVNQLAETAEFGTGLDFHPGPLRWELAKGVTRRLGFIFSVGASGPFTPGTRLKLFQVPDPASPQYPRFATQFPDAAHSLYAAFLPSDRDRFYRAYGAGIRLTTMYQDPGDPEKSTRAPATYTVTIGQDENVTGGSLRGPVLKFDVFYPLPLKANGTRYLYFFGMAGLRLTRAENAAPYVLNPAPAGITGSESSVAIVAAPSNRDVYRLGVGIDAVSIVCAWKPAWCQ